MKMYFTNANQVDSGTYLDNVHRFRPIGFEEGASAGIDTQIGLPKPAHVDDSTNVTDYIWAELIAIEPPESWPEVDDDFPNKCLCTGTLIRELNSDKCHAAKETSNMWTSFSVWMRYAGRRMRDPPPTSQEGRNEFYRKFVQTDF